MARGGEYGLEYAVACAMQSLKHIWLQRNAPGERSARFRGVDTLHEYHLKVSKLASVSVMAEVGAKIDCLEMGPRSSC